MGQQFCGRCGDSVSPQRPPHPCPTPGCPATVTAGSHCPEHEAVRRVKSPEQAKFYGSTQWKRLRAVIRYRDPICTECGMEPTKVVDHRDGDWRNNDPSNLRGLGIKCNATITAKQHRRKVG